MIDWREITWEFVSSRYGTSRPYFEALWEAAGELSATSRIGDKRTATRRLSIVGDEEDEVVIALLVMRDVGKKLGNSIEPELLRAILKESADVWHPPRQLLEDILERLQRLDERLDILGIQKPDDRNLRDGVCARLWKKGGKAGGEEILTKEDLQKVLKSPPAQELLVIDRGEFREGIVGEVRCGKNLISLPNNSRVSDFGRLEYRILVHTLRNGGAAGNYVELAEACWKDIDPNFIVRLKKEWVIMQGVQTGPQDYKDARSRFASEVRRIRTPAHLLSTILEQKGGLHAKFWTERTRQYHFSPVPGFCLIEVFPSQN